MLGRCRPERAADRTGPRGKCRYRSLRLLAHGLGARHHVGMDGATSPEWPSRTEVEQRWQALVDGIAAREDVHDWAVTWVEGESGPCRDAMVPFAMQYLHGFDMTHDPDAPSLISHGPPGTYVKSMDDIRTDLAYWRRNCREYDT